MGLFEESQKGRSAGLVELRGMLAKQLDECQSGRDFAALTRAYLDVVARLDAEGVPTDEGVLDELKRKRAARGA